MYKGFRGDVPVCERVWVQLLTLPLFPGLTDADVNMIVSQVQLFQPAVMPA